MLLYNKMELFDSKKLKEKSKWFSYIILGYIGIAGILAFSLGGETVITGIVLIGLCIVLLIKNPGGYFRNKSYNIQEHIDSKLEDINNNNTIEIQWNTLVKFKLHPPYQKKKILLSSKLIENINSIYSDQTDYQLYINIYFEKIFGISGSFPIYIWYGQTNIKESINAFKNYDNIKFSNYEVESEDDYKLNLNRTLNKFDNSVILSTDKSFNENILIQTGWNVPFYIELLYGIIKKQKINILIFDENYKFENEVIMELNQNEDFKNDFLKIIQKFDIEVENSIILSADGKIAYFDEIFNLSKNVFDMSIYILPKEGKGNNQLLVNLNSFLNSYYKYERKLNTIENDFEIKNLSTFWEMELIYFRNYDFILNYDKKFKDDLIKLGDKMKKIFVNLKNGLHLDFFKIEERMMNSFVKINSNLIGFYDTILSRYDDNKKDISTLEDIYELIIIIMKNLNYRIEISDDYKKLYTNFTSKDRISLSENEILSLIKHHLDNFSAFKMQVEETMKYNKNLKDKYSIFLKQLEKVRPNTDLHIDKLAKVLNINREEVLEFLKILENEDKNYGRYIELEDIFVTSGLINEIEDDIDKLILNFSRLRNRKI